MDDLSARKMAVLIGEALAEDGITQAEFCRRVGVSTKHLNTVLTGKATAREAQLDYWAFVLGRKFHIELRPFRQPSDDAARPSVDTTEGDAS